ncbi:hypothetical protein Tco_0452848 [Tanacetum coccineum]
MKNLKDSLDKLLGDHQFLNDKPTEDDQEKSKVVDESDSTIPDPSHQIVRSTPPVIAPIVDFSSPKPSLRVTTPPINTEATSIIITLPEITSFIALQLRVAKLEQDMSEVKKTDHSAAVLASIKSQVPIVVDKYLGTKLDDALLRILERHTADLIEKYSVLPGPESIKNQESKKNEDAMDKEVKDRVKDHKRKHDSDDDEDDDDDEGPSAGSNQGHVSDLEDTDNAHIPKVTAATWFKPIPEDESPATPEPEWTIPPNDFLEPENNWANVYAITYQVPAENKLQRKMYDIGSFIKWFCRGTGKKKLCKADLEGPAFNLVKAFHKNNVFLQFQMDECHKLLTNKVDLVNPEGHQILRNIYELLPLEAPPVQVTKNENCLSVSSQSRSLLDSGLEELVPFCGRKEFYINKHSEPSDHEAVRSQMRILSVIRIKTFEKYGYNYLREIILHRADYKEYKISEKDFKNLHPNDFEYLYLLNIQDKLNHLSKSDKTHLHTAINMWIRNLVIRNRVGDLQLRIESYQTKLNLERPNWDAADYFFKQDYTIVPKPRAVIYRDRNDQRKLMRLNEIHKFSDGTLTRVMEKLDQMVKDFRLFEYNKGIKTMKWSEDDKKRSKDFITAIEKRLQIRRIFQSLESFVGGRIRYIDYMLINRTT